MSLRKENISVAEKAPQQYPELLKFPNDRNIRNAWSVYAPSTQTKSLLSETERHVFGEEFDCGDSKFFDSLKMMCLNKIVKSYKGGQLDKSVQSYDKIHFGEKIDIELPVKDIAPLENDIFWKRVCEKKCKEKWVYEEACVTDDFDWRRMGVELKFAELIENTSYEDFDIEKLLPIAKKVQPYCRSLNILQMRPIRERSLEKSSYNPFYRIQNYPPKDCHHGKFGSLLHAFHYLTSLSIRYGLLECRFSYDRRIFEVSYDDIENLANGIQHLENLKEFSLTRSRLDDRKCKILCRALAHCPIEKLDLSYCELSDDSGKALGKFLIKNITLKELELRGNFLCKFGLQGIGFGLQNFRGRLVYLGLAGNTVTEAGVLAIGGGFNHSNHITKLDFCQCDVGAAGAFRIAQIVGFHMILEYLNMSATPLGKEQGAIRLIENITKNKTITFLECKCCGLTENQERKVRILIERNKFYKDNPPLSKAYFTKEDATEVEHWINKIRHPSLNKVLDKIPSIDSFDVKLRKTDYGEIIPTFMSDDERNVATKTELLKSFYLDSTSAAADSDTRLFDPNNSRRSLDKIEAAHKFSYEPNDFDSADFVEAAIIGRLYDLSSSYYFP